MTISKQLTTDLVLGAILFTGVACSNVKLTPLEKEKVVVQNKGEICTKLPDDLNRMTKFLFIVDQSGSNQSGGVFGGGGTDPNSVKRADSIKKFYDDNKAEASFSWGIMGFQEDSANPYTGPVNDLFTKDQTKVNSAIGQLKGNDVGSTPYKAALITGVSAIESDIKKYPADDAYYMVFFMSDGDPTDVSNVSELQSLVEQLVNTKPGKVFLSTTYYGPKNDKTENNLKEMARYGNGKYLNLNESDTTDFNKLLVKPTKEPYQVKNTRMIVYNLNAGFCLDGKIGTDSDSDGVCDRDELVYGMDPTKRFSLTDDYDTGNSDRKPRIDPATGDYPAGANKVGTARSQTQGYSDLFRLREIRLKNALEICSDRTDEDHDLLTKCEEAFIKNDDSSNQVNGDPKNPDTDGDGLIDGIEIMAYTKDLTLWHPLERNDANTSYDNEADSAGTQIIQHRNPLTFDPDAFKYDTRIDPKGSGVNDQGQSCYDFNQSNLQLFDTQDAPDADNLPGLGHRAHENKVLIYYIQTPHSSPNSKGIFVYSVQTLNAQLLPGKNAGLVLSDELFSSYKVP